MSQGPEVLDSRSRPLGLQTRLHRIADVRGDRIIILSDMQAWVGHATPADAFKRYGQKHRCNPHLYCFNLVSYGDTQFPAKGLPTDWIQRQGV